MAAKKIEKTNAARLLDRAKIPYTLIPYEVDEEDLSCTHVAAQLGEAIECVFKTLVLKGDRSGYFVCVEPGDHEVDLKAGRPCVGQQEGRPDPDEGAAARHGLYPGRLFAHRHETCLSHLYSFVVPRSVRDLCERRRARKFADPDRTRCADRIHAGRNGRLDPERG